MTLQEMTQKIVEFRKERDWEKFHTLKDLAMALNVEAGEVAECFLWKTDDQLKNLTEDQRKEIALEIGDVFISYCCCLMTWGLIWRMHW